MAQALADRADGELGAGVDRATWCEDLDARNRAQVDDVAAALLEKAGKGRRDAVERTLQIDVDHLVPLVGVDLGHRTDRHLNCPGFCGDGTTREVRRIHEQQIEAFST
ncbi:hypothetical protein S101468_03031 (plasmid) [Acetobacter pasteurianus subsp. pasteurianus]|uniref:Uncharacterized protein n=1 Tax=Acetobacter pasteurianus subsp. pasteurianus TaxID=481145 RepID=A0AAC9SVB8_ACEPA|nr:hypothetical protein S101468_03031 [Acetobacter pasteurianus subsp. pasteurianus]